MHSSVCVKILLTGLALEQTQTDSSLTSAANRFESLHGPAINYETYETFKSRMVVFCNPDCMC